ncbi:little elongation complex subunit 1 [Carcharodon carcharias]|uniref:little elongation complex subunit 1 n=1 Tax=Carcharodon carcharias TaxID=13397 RepID=UPI001B7F59FA|nr:little elongation complex subunit 1 [Carcharodon carcharias]
MMPGESRSQAAEVVADAVTAGSASCMNCDTLQQNLNEYVTALIALKQKIIDTDHVLTEYQKKCDELQKTERDCKTLRDQLDELLQKFSPLEKCKEEMDAMRVELEEKRSSVKMYQQTHLEFNELQQEQIRNDAVKKKLESRVKRLEETTTKQNAEIKQLKKEKTTLERNLKKTQEKLMLQQKNGIKVLKDAQTQNAVQEVPMKIDTNKVKVLLEEIWMCIEKPNVQEKPNKSPGKKGPSQKKCKTLRSSLSNPNHSSLLETPELPTSSPPHQLECDQEKNKLSKMDESLTDEGLQSNDDSAFHDDKTIELTRQKDPDDSPTGSSTDTDGGDDDEQDALSRQLQEILDWTEPLPPQLSPLPCSPSYKKQNLFGDITDSSDDESSNLPRKSCSESVLEIDQLYSSGCTDAPITDEASMAEAGISARMVGELSAEKMDCSEAETEGLNEHCLKKAEVEAEMSDPYLIVKDAQCRNENNMEVQFLPEETQTRAPEMYNVKNLTSPQHNYNDGMQGDDTTESSKDNVVLVVSNLKTVEPELDRSKPCSREECGADTCVKEVENEELVPEKASAFGQLGATFEALEMAEINCNSFACGSQRGECTLASMLPPDLEHTISESVTKEQIGTTTVEEVISFSQLNSKVIHGVAEDKSTEYIPTGQMEIEENNCNHFIPDRQKGGCTQTLLQPTDVVLPQAESLTKEQNLNKMQEVTPSAEVYCFTETAVSREQSKNCISTGCTEMEEINSGTSTSDNEKDKCTLSPVPASDFEQTQTEFHAEERSGLDKMQEIAPPSDFDYSIETSISQDKSKNFVFTDETEMDNINSISLISDNHKDKCILTSVVSKDIEEFVAKEQNGLDRIQETAVLGKTDNSVISDGAKDHICTGGVEVKDVDSKNSTPGSPNSSEQECIQHDNSVLIIKEKDSINKLKEVISLECSMVADTTQESSTYSRDMEVDEVDLNGSTSNREKDENISTLLPVGTELTQAESTKGQDYLNEVEQASPLAELDSSVISGVIQDECKGYRFTQVVTMEDDSSSESASIECTLISVESSIEELETKPINEYDTKTKDGSPFLKPDSSFVVTNFAQDRSTGYTSTMETSNKCEKLSFLSTWSESTEDIEKVMYTVRESPVDKWNGGKDKLVENENSDIGEINNHTLKLSGECLSSDQIATQFEINTYSTQSTNADVLQDSVREEDFVEVGQNNACDTLNNNIAESEENANSKKSEDTHLKSRKLPGNEIQLPLQEPGTASTQICETNPQNSEAEVSMLVRKIKRKQWHRKILTPQGETPESIDQNVVEDEIRAEVSTPENLNHELKVQAGNEKLETEHHTLSVNGHVTVQCAELPFDSKSVSESNETVCNIECITNAKDESTATHPDCIESKLMTLDEDFQQDVCRTSVCKANADTNMNSENVVENGNNTMSVRCEASALDLDTPPLKVFNNEPLSELSPNTDELLECTQTENKNLVKNNLLQNEPEVEEKLKNSSEVGSNQGSICIKEQFGIQIKKNTIGIADEMSNCISSVKKVNNSTNTPIEGTSSHKSLVQTVDSSTQTENDGSQIMLYTSSDLFAAAKSVPQMDIVEEGEVGTPKSKRHLSYCDLWNPSFPDVPSDHRRPIHTVALHEEGALFESTVDNSVDMESFGTSECEQTPKKTAKSKKMQSCRRLPTALTEGNGDVQQNDILQKSNIQSTCKSRVVLRRNKRGSNPDNPPVQASADTSAPVLCTQEIHQVMLEMGKPLPPLLPPLVATPPRTARAAKPMSPLSTTSGVASLCSPADDLASPSKETSKAASVSPPLDYNQRKSPSLHSPSPLEFARTERIQSSPLQFCTATPKHAVPVPGRLPQSASSTGGSALPQENSVKILDAMYPNLSARARTLNILRGNVQLSIRGPADSENQAGAVNQIMGFKAINSAATAFVKAGSNTRSEGTKTDEKDLEQQQPAVARISSTEDKPKKNQMATKRSAEGDGAGKAKRLKAENNCQNEDITTDLITPQESSTVNVIDTTKPLFNGLVEQTTGYKAELEHFSQPLESINSSDEAIASALMKITKSCFDLLPVIRSHVFVGNIPQIPVLRDEEKEVIFELNGNKDLTEALLMAIIKKLKAEQTTLDGNCLQALSRVYVAICRQQGDLERARLLSYSILKEDFPDSSKLLLLILSVWQNIFSTQGPVNKAMQAVAKQRAKGDVLNCLNAYLNWEKNPPLDVSSLVSSFLIAMQQSPKVRFQISNEYGMDFNGDMWELIYAIDLLCSQQPWTWTHNCFIRKEVWPVMDKWMKHRKGQNSILCIRDVTVAGIMRLIGHLGQQGLKKESSVAVKNMAAVINKFLEQAFQEGVPWPVQLSAVYAVYDLAPSNPEGALEALHTWKASVTELIPSAASNCLMELEILCQRLNSEVTNP